MNGVFLVRDDALAAELRRSQEVPSTSRRTEEMIIEDQSEQQSYEDSSGMEEDEPPQPVQTLESSEGNENESDESTEESSDESEMRDSDAENEILEFLDDGGDVEEEEVEEDLPDYDPENEGFESPLLNDPAYPGSELTLQQHLLTIMKFASKEKMSLSGLESLLQTFSLLLPQGNRIPTTVYKLFAMLELNIEKFQKHVCKNDCFVFTDVDKSEYHLHAEDTCPKCHEKRFVRNGRALSPAKKFYSFPIYPQIGRLKNVPGFNESLAKMWAEIQKNPTCYQSFWGGSLAKEYLAEMEDLNDFHQTLLLCLGMDGVNVFKDKYEIYPIGVRIWNLHPEDRSKKMNVLLAALVPGPTAPKSVEPYLKPLLDEIAKSHQGNGIRIQNDILNVEENVSLNIVTCMQDQKSMGKSTEHLGPSAKKNCWRCHNVSEPNEGCPFHIFPLLPPPPPE